MNSATNGTAPSPPTELQKKLKYLVGKRDHIESLKQRRKTELDKIRDYLDIAPAVETALVQLTEQLFGQIVKDLEKYLTLALQEVLEQPIAFKVERDNKRGVTTMSFHIERNGQGEDIMKGQGGSVANILSVGLRMLGLTYLTKLNESEHRRFLILDEQDCWLRPDLVPRLVKIVHEAGKALGFQVIMISHHDVSAFQQYAKKIYQFIPKVDGVEVKERVAGPLKPDE